MLFIWQDILLPEETAFYLIDFYKTRGKFPLEKTCLDASSWPF